MPSESHLYFGGPVRTLEPSLPLAEAIALRDGRIAAVGSEATCRAALGRGFAETPLRGRAVLPGFIDTHLHPVPMIFFDLNADLRGVPSLAELRARLEQASARTGPGRWVVGLQFDEQDLAERRLPTRRDLDGACPDRPLLVLRRDGHTVIANTRALEAAGITASTEAPAGGAIDREPDGTPAGIFRETAAGLLLGAMPLPDLGEIAAAAATTFARLAACGITSAGVILQTDAEGPAGRLGAFDVGLLETLLPQVPQRLYAILIGGDLARVKAARAGPLHDPAGEAGHRVGGIKLYADGTFGSCTACMRAPFSDHPEERGFMTLDEAEMLRRMRAAHAEGLQLAIHAIGDAANRRCIDLYQRLLREAPRADHRHRLEHASLLDAEMIADLARLGLVVSTQPLFIHSEKGWLHRRLGTRRARDVYPLRSLVEAGVRVAGASDAPVESPDVLHAIECCVTREGFEAQQGIGVTSALRLYTVDAAHAQFEEETKGTLRAGKYADLVVLGADPLEVAPDEIHAIPVERTVVGGRVVYERG